MNKFEVVSKHNSHLANDGDCETLADSARYFPVDVILSLDLNVDQLAVTVNG